MICPDSLALSLISFHQGFIIFIFMSFHQINILALQTVKNSSQYATFVLKRAKAASIDQNSRLNLDLNMRFFKAHHLDQLRNQSLIFRNTDF